jgi:hypothetical protein
MLVLNTAQLRVEQNKLLKAFGKVTEAIGDLGITGKDKEDIDGILGKHFEKKLNKLIDEHRCLPEEMGREEKEAPAAGGEKKSEVVKADHSADPARPSNIEANGVQQTEDVDAF